MVMKSFYTSMEISYHLPALLAAPTLDVLTKDSPVIEAVALRPLLLPKRLIFPKL